MQNKLTAILSFVLFVLSCSSLTPVRIHMIGDSTMADKPTEGNPERGWGQLLYKYFKSDVQIYNHARNGRSSKSFIDEGHWQNVLDSLRPGDFVVIQFGHNDEKEQDLSRYTDPATTFKQNLKKFIRETREKSALPILCTPIMRRRFDEEGKFYDTHGKYPDAFREVSITTKTALIDMHKKSEQLIISHGKEGSKKLFLFIEPGKFSTLPEGKEDNTHFSEYGAYGMAGLAVEGFRELNLPLTKYLK
jgi:DNA sulfur modification protein DndE